MGTHTATTTTSTTTRTTTSTTISHTSTRTMTTRTATSTTTLTTITKTTTTTGSSTSTSTTSTDASQVMTRFNMGDESARCGGMPAMVNGKTWGGLGEQITRPDCLNACLAESLCTFSVCLIRTSDDMCIQCSAFM